VSARLIDRGLVGPDGELTAQGKDVRDDVEDRTDRIALAAYDTLDGEQLVQCSTLSPRLPELSSPQLTSLRSRPSATVPNCDQRADARCLAKLPGRSS
jgi:hypothetical protein